MSAWGDAWGLSWGDAWGEVDTSLQNLTATTVVPSSHTICSRSGFKYKVGHLVQEPDGAWVHPKFAEPKHPSELAGHMRPERVKGSPRPEKDSKFLNSDNPVSADDL